MNWINILRLIVYSTTKFTWNQIVEITSEYNLVWFQRFHLDVIEWIAIPNEWFASIKFTVYTDAGRFQRKSPYFYSSHLQGHVPRPLIPDMQGTFIIIHLHQAGPHTEIKSFKISYLILYTRPSPALEDIFQESGKPFGTGPTIFHRRHDPVRSPLSNGSWALVL